MIRFHLKKRLRAAQGDLSLEVDSEIPEGTFLTLYGPSGVGKTSILRMLAGLLPPDEGKIEVKGQIWLDTKEKINWKPQQRNIGFVFQDYALFPNMTVRQNLEYALLKNQNPSIIEELVELVELENLQHRKSTRLSGGQQQRVALARALVRQPDLLLLDEPLSALDYSMRQKLQDYLLRVHERYQLTTILVSHELSEVFKMADQTLVLEEGKVIKSGTPLEVFSTTDPQDAAVQLIGDLISVEEVGKEWIYTLLIGGKLMRIKRKEKAKEALKPGDKILVSIHQVEATLSRVD